MLATVWEFLKDEGNRAVLSWVGGGILAVAAGVWTVFTFLARRGESGSSPSAKAQSTSVAINNPIHIGLDEAGVRRVLQDELSGIAKAKGVAEAPLRTVLKKLGETQVPQAEIPARLAAAADELIRLRTDLARLRNDRPEFGAIRARASALIDKGEFDGARSELQKGRAAARASKEEISRSEAGFLADEARVDKLQLNREAACAKLAEAARLDPDNVWIWIELGDLWVMRGSLAEAEKAFRAATESARRSGDERDLSVSYNRVGDVQVAQGDLAGALKSYRDSLAIRDRLATSDPGNAGWQRDLSVSYEKIGDVQVAQGDLSGALKSYRDSLAIRERLATSDPGNAGWQRDLSVSYTKLADAHGKMNEPTRAREALAAGRTIVARLVEQFPDWSEWKKDLAWFDRQIAALKN
ncbi:MAG: tetratricopeptide repeat protein [Hyphomicrobiales bacterium]